MKKIFSLCVVGALLTPITSQADEVFLTDLVIQGNGCVGPECGSAEYFADNTLKIKSTQPNILFEDTSPQGVAPSNDWQIQINNDLTENDNTFSINDVTAGTTPFTIEAGAPTESFYINSYGNLGIGTSFPVRELHLVDRNSPGIRLEQDDSGGFVRQSWDIFGNEGQFSIYDATTHTTPFIVESNSPTNALTLTHTGSVGIGTYDPLAQLHIANSDETTATRNLLRLENNGGSSIMFIDNSLKSKWAMKNKGDRFLVTKVGTGKNEFMLSKTGNLKISGALIETSDRNAKTDIQPVNPQKVLEKAVNLKISTWRYKTDPVDVYHMGPMAQDFYGAFGLGSSEKTISTLDTSAVALASIQALYEKLEILKAKLKKLEEEKQL